MKKHILLFLSAIVLLSCSSVKTVFTGETINFKATDDLQVTADLYMTKNTEAPLILLFHQAGYSRGEYREIAPILNEMGFNCLAIDQRSGITINGVNNETNKVAKKLNKPTKYVSAIPDIIGAYLYAKNTLKSKEIIIWGSSYSAALTFYLGSQYPNDIKGILSFSPGEYFKINEKEIKSYATKINCPLFLTSAKNEQLDWQGIYDNVPSKKQFFLPTLKGNHGSKALWKENESHEEYWGAVREFLAQFK